MKKERIMRLPSGMLITASEVRTMRVLLTEMAVYSDTAIQMKRELTHAVRKGVLI